MRNRIATLAAAGVAVAIVFWALGSLAGTPVKAVDLVDVAEAMQKVPWMHAIATGFEQAKGDVTEHWMGFATRIQADVSSNGDATFMSEQDRRRWDYDPDSNTITIRRLEAFPIDIASAGLMPALVRRAWEQQGAQAVVKRGTYRGRDVQIQDITWTDASSDWESLELVLYIDPDSKLLYGTEVSVVGADGSRETAGTVVYDYPPSGPGGIHDLGVPADALVVDETPAADFNAVWQEYKRRKAEATDTYIAAIVHQDSFDSDDVRELRLDFKSGGQARLDRHLVTLHDEVIPGLKNLDAEPSGHSFESLIAWGRSRYDDSNAIVLVSLYDGQFEYTVDRESGSGWGRVNKVMISGGESGSSLTMAYLGWSAIPSTARVISDDYARENGLICIEELTQGRAIGNLGVSHPGRFLYYLDPDHDYLCRQQVMEWRPNAEWQLDRDYLEGIAPGRVGSGTIIVREITEFVQAPNGHWYPNVIVSRQTQTPEDYAQGRLDVTGVSTIYVDVSPTFPESAFDADNLPRR